MNNINLDEKLRLLIGKNTWEFNSSEKLNIKTLRVNDGPHGLRKIMMEEGQRKETTAFPTAVNLANTFNPSLVAKVGSAIAEECLEANVHVILGPGINLKRTPLGGRCFEYYSEDPYLTGKIAQGFIKGVQKKKVGTSLKHFICNEQEYYRLTSSTEVDDLAFYNLYLKAFKLALEANPTTVMASYNKLNGTYTTENKFLLTDILRDKLNYKGIVVSDWGAVNNIVDAVNNGLNIEMPYCGEYFISELKKAYNEKRLTDKVINQRIKEIKSIQKRISFEKGYIADLEKHHELAKKVSDESIILLKNDGSLPLNKKEKTLFIGAFCENLIIQATGSAKVQYPNKIEVVEYLKNNNYSFDYLQGYNIDDDYLDDALIDEVVNKVDNYNQVVLFLGLYEGLEGEGYDRYSFSLPNNQLTLLNKLLEKKIKLNVVVAGGSSVDLSFSKDLSSLIFAYMSGESGAESIVDILYGKVNPSGRLSETLAYSVDDIPASHYKAGNNAVNYKESVYVGYRYFDKAKVDVLYPFGYGLSYSNFEYCDFNISSVLEGTFKIKNTSNITGSEVYQIYLRKPNSHHLAPVKELVSFGKVKISKNSQKTINYKLDEEELKTYVKKYNDYVVLSGEYEVYIGKNVNEIIYSKVFNINTDYHFEDYQVPLWYLNPNSPIISDEDFSKILSRRVEKHQIKIKNYTINTSLNDFMGLDSGEFITKREINWINSLFPLETLRKQNEMRAGLSSPIKCKAVFDPEIDWCDVLRIVEEANNEVALKERLATIDDLDAVLGIYIDAQEKFEKEKTYQWIKGYPNKETFINDILNNKVYVTLRASEIVGVYTAISTGEEDYLNIDGTWVNNENYLTIHRIAVKKEYYGYGVGSFMFESIKNHAKEAGLNNVRIDTHKKNIDMKTLLTKKGFIKCGVIMLRDKKEYRDAYQLVINDGE